MNREAAVYSSLEIVERRITEKLTVENLAGSVYFSPYHYERLFREIVGDSVMHYVTKRKLTIAGAMLLETDKTITDIGYALGYNSHENFTRAFKSYMGIAPKEYRKYGLSSISQKQIKERCSMYYGENTDEMIRELQDFIVRAKGAAQMARKCTLQEYLPFWSSIADNTDALAEQLKIGLERISDIAQNPDAIVNRFAIIKLVEDIAFKTNLISFNVNLMVSRGKQEHIAIQTALCQQYISLAQASMVKTGKILALFNELSQLIFCQIKQDSQAKLHALLESGQKAAESIHGYLYIKDEVIHIINELSQIPCEKISVQRLEDFLFRLQIISFAAEMDTFRSPKDKASFSQLDKLKEAFSEAIDFFSSLAISLENPVIERSLDKHFQDIAYQCNILLFYTRGELSMEKLGSYLTPGQTAVWQGICLEIDDVIHLALHATEKSAYKPVSDMLYAINAKMLVEADSLWEKGGAIRFLANEVNRLADKVAVFI